MVKCNYKHAESLGLMANFGSFKPTHYSRYTVYVKELNSTQTEQSNHSTVNLTAANYFSIIQNVAS